MVPGFGARGPSPATPPDTLWFLAPPNVESRDALAELGRSYQAADPDTVRDAGYAMAVIRLVRRAGIDTAVALSDVAVPRR
jgi:hypothetical protein